MMKSLSLIVITTTLLGLPFDAAKAKDAPIPSPPPYTTVGLEKFAQPGTCQIVGRALVPTKTFGPLVFASQKIHLVPLTDFSLWYVKRLAELREDSTLRYPAELAQFSRDATSDSNGNFSFNNIVCGDYLLEMLTDYQSDSHNIENRTIYSTNDDDFPSSMTTQRIRTKIRREIDVAAATSSFTHEHEQMTVSTFSVLGLHQCCDGEI